MNKSEIFSYLTKNVSGYTVGQMVTNLIVIFALSLVIFAVYKLTTKRVNYYSNFAIVLVLTSVVTGIIMMIIESNLALSLGMVGALSIIRFRSAIKDPVDTGYIFWAVAIGISAGTGNFILAVIATLLISIFVIAFSFISKTYLKEVLIIRGENLSAKEINSLLKAKGVNYTQKSKSSGRTKQEYIYEITCKNSDMLLDALRNVNGVENVNIVSGVNI